MAAEGVPAVGAAKARRRVRAVESVDGLYAAAILVSIAATLLVLLRGIEGHVILPTVDLLMDTVALVVCSMLTAVAWARFRESNVLSAVYQAAAFLALAVSYAIAVAITLEQSGTIGGMIDPRNVQILVFAVAQLAAAVLFVIAGSFTSRSSYGWFPHWILVAPSLGVFLAAFLGTAVSPPPSLEIVLYTDPSGLPTISPFGAAVGLVTAGLFFVGAYVSRGIWHSHRALVDGWIAIGLVFAGFGELHWLLFPSAHPGQVSTGDLFRLACFVALLFGLESAVRAGLRDLRVANAELSELREAEVELVALEERTRLARELHDGLAQDLWLAKLRTGELAAMEGLSPAARRAAQDAEAAIEIGLGEARDAVATLRRPAPGSAGFGNALRGVVEDYGDRFGLRVVFTLDEQVPARIAARTQAEILRIVQEALTNIAKHADATVVGVRLTVKGDRIMLRVVDNGRGFDVRAAGDAGYGLTSMRERALLIGGRLRIASRPGAGTRVMLTAPFAWTRAVTAAQPR